MKNLPATRVTLSADNLQVAEGTFRQVCSQCHALSQVDAAPPRTDAEVDAVLQRMAGNGMRTDRRQVELIQQFLRSKYVK